METQAMVEKVCKHLPDGWELSVCMENGAAWVTLHNPDGDRQELPDATDKSMDGQINEAICVATGFVSPNAKLTGGPSGPSG